MSKAKVIRVCTVPLSLDKLLRGQLAFMREHFELLAVSSPGEQLQQVGEREGVPTRAIPMTRKITPVQDLWSIWQCYQLFKKEKPTIVHTHTPKAGLVGMLAARMAGVPLRIHTVAGLPLTEAGGLKRKVLDLAERLVYGAATHVWPNSKGLYDFIVAQNYCAPSKLKIIGQGSSNGIDTAYFDPALFSREARNELQKDLGITAKDRVFVFVGRMVRDKGVNELVEAFTMLHKEASNTKLLLVGPYEDRLDPLNSETVARIDTHPAIVHVGYREDVRPYLSVAHILAFPSYREGFPNVVMQAGAMGLPAIVSDINGCNEIVIDGANGLVVPPKDSNALQKAMHQLLTDGPLRERLAGRARKLVAERYEQSQLWEALLNEYRTLLNNLP